jgi:hypothetical protein
MQNTGTRPMTNPGSNGAEKWRSFPFAITVPVVTSIAQLVEEKQRVSVCSPGFGWRLPQRLPSR